MCRQRPLFCSRWLSNTAPSTKGGSSCVRNSRVSQVKPWWEADKVDGGFAFSLPLFVPVVLCPSLPYLYMIRFCVRAFLDCSVENVWDRRCVVMRWCSVVVVVVVVVASKIACVQCSWVFFDSRLGLSLSGHGCVLSSCTIQASSCCARWMRLAGTGSAGCVCSPP